jgi:hypothetical protein
MVIYHHRLTVCILVARHLLHNAGKFVLLISQITCAASILHLKTTWMTTA